MSNDKLNLKVDLSQTDEMICEKCLNNIFVQGYLLKKLSPLMSPTGQATIIPIQIFQCSKCGYVPADFLSAFDAKPKESNDSKLVN